MISKKIKKLQEIVLPQQWNHTNVSFAVVNLKKFVLFKKEKQTHGILSGGLGRGVERGIFNACANAILISFATFVVFETLNKVTHHQHMKTTPACYINCL